MEECLFCRILNKEIKAEIVYQDAEILVIPDIKPAKRVHLLVLPSVHIKSFLDLQDEQFSMLTKMAKVIQRLIEEKKLHGAYQLLFNGGKYQHIPHLHWHLMGD